tara:strand:+ start:472 stop:801 length:330 start_codon:yes stop_codon:yes gene_type:complete
MEHENTRKSSRSERRHRTKGKYEGTIRLVNSKDYIINSRVSKYHQDKRIRNRRAEKMGWNQGNSTTHSDDGNYESNDNISAWEAYIAYLAWENYIFSITNENKARMASH